MRFRAGALLVAGWYLVIAANLPIVIAEQVLPKTLDAATSSPLTRPQCGCSEEAQRQRRCCCHSTLLRSRSHRGSGLRDTGALSWKRMEPITSLRLRFVGATLLMKRCNLSRGWQH